MREGVGAVLRHVDCPEGSGPVEHSQEGQAMNRTVLGGAVRGRGGRARGCEIDQGAVLWRVYARSCGQTALECLVAALTELGDHT